jgi:hypothetical protein
MRLETLKDATLSGLNARQNKQISSSQSWCASLTAITTRTYQRKFLFGSLILLRTNRSGDKLIVRYRSKSCQSDLKHHLESSLIAIG